MKKFLLATVSMVALSAVARAADMPAAMPTKGPMYSPVPVTTWDALYIGVQGGVVRRDALFKEAGVGGLDRDGSRTGGIAGVLLGYNWQQGSFVYGVEGDWSWVGARTSRLVAFNFSESYDINWLATVRARAGLAVDLTLFYLTGGAAFGHVNNDFALGNPIIFSFPQKQTKLGWTAGAGVEHEFAPHWTARAEVRYVDLGKSSVDCTPGTGSCFPGYRSEFSNSLWMGLVGLNYRFGGGRAADWSHAQAYAPAPGFGWAGGYLGVQGGVAQNYAAFNDLDVFLPVGGSLFDHRKAGGTVGGLLGYNWQSGSFVYGLEGDWNWIRSKASRVDSNADNNLDSLSISFEANWLATLRGRVGFAFDSTLLYVTGGAAFGHVKNSIELISGRGASDGVASFAQNQTKVGWTAGVGAEYMLSPHWTARAEFRYVDLGKTTVSCSSVTNFDSCATAGPAGAYRGEFSNALKLGLVGLSYKF